MIKPGDYVVYMRRGTAHCELGRVLRRNNADDGWFVFYSAGETAGNTPDDCVFELANLGEISPENLGGSRARQFDGYPTGRLEVPCLHGKLVAEFFGAAGEYDGVAVDLVKPDGAQTQCCVVETVASSGELHALVWDGNGECPVHDQAIDPNGENVY